ncbi:hypothetical protein P3L10_023032 [Capsicum annuum]
MATVKTDAAELRSKFLHVLRSRCPPEVPLSVVPGKPAKDPFFLEPPKPNFSEAMASCPKEDIPNFKELLQEENFYLTTEEGGITTYRDALVSSWKNGDTMPFIFDTAWDLIKLADYLTEREDIDPSKIGITGESLGGMHVWVLDGQLSMISGKQELTVSRLYLKVWDRIAPGLASQFDAPYTVPTIAPRPLLILNGEDDPRCPLGGLEIPESRVCKAYEEANCPQNIKLIAQPGIGHRMTPLMVKEASDWFDRFLKV